MKKVVDEKVLVEKILSDGFSRNNHPTFQELLVLAKYFRKTYGYGEKKIVKALGDFLNKDSEILSSTPEEYLIRVASISIRDDTYRQPKFPILISEDEINRISDAEDFNYRRVLFSSLVVAKSSGNPRIFSDSDKDIRLIISISGFEKDKDNRRFSVKRFVEEVTPLAKELQLFQHINAKRHFYTLMGRHDGDIALRVVNYDEMLRAGEIYTKYIGGVMVYCSRCGEEFIRKRKENTVCDSCS